MDREKKNIENHGHSFTTWVKKHKKGILIAGGTIVAIGTGYVIYKNRDYIHSLFTSIKPEPIVNNNQHISVEATKPVVDVISETSSKMVNKIVNDGEAYSVCEHIRNLPKSSNASAEKVALASEHGFKLVENQTWVESYLKNCA